MHEATSPTPKFVVNMDATPMRLADLTQYQEGAIVSKEIYSKQAGTITVFAFEEHQGLSAHTAPFDAYVYILDGKAKITIADRDFPLKVGEIILMPAGVPHAVKAITKFKMLLTLMRA
jgi:quercetin dioxygenase-like cupin family protein